MLWTSYHTPSISGFSVSMTDVAICSVLPHNMTGKGDSMSVMCGNVYEVSGRNVGISINVRSRVQDTCSCEIGGCKTTSPLMHTSFSRISCIWEYESSCKLLMLRLDRAKAVQALSICCKSGCSDLDILTGTAKHSQQIAIWKA
jgi:hypothetical protein